MFTCTNNFCHGSLLDVFQKMSSAQTLLCAHPTTSH
jgi:hypothetical protein